MLHNHEICPQQGRGVAGIGHTLTSLGRRPVRSAELLSCCLRSSRGLGQITAAIDEWISSALCLPALPPSLPAAAGMIALRGALGFACHVVNGSVRMLALLEAVALAWPQS
jgi:hypothetical protein